MATSPKKHDGEILAPGHTYGSITDKISSVVLKQRSPRSWWIGLAISLVLLQLLFVSVAYLFMKGIGIWGVNVPVGWGFAIVTFVWWIGIGHAGTLISAVLLLAKQEWRTSINRFAEAMTLFAVACAGIYPLIHMGRPWLFYYLIPYPNTMGLWPQFRSPLVWDLFAISTYATVSLLFWYVGLVPDLATLRDRAKRGISRITYGVFALGWRGSAVHWQRYNKAYLILAGLATPLVVSVHSIVGLDFAVAILPGWHETVFPPYFVAGAIFSGFAMVVTLSIPLRAVYGLQDFITAKHLDNMAKILLATSLLVAYGYGMELFHALYTGGKYEEFLTWNRAFGPYAWAWWMLLVCNVAAPQLFWFRWARRNVYVLFVLSLVINLGMWLERFVIVVVSLHRDYLPSSWGMYYPTFWDWATLLGTLGLFGSLLFVFVRVLPMISIYEMRELAHEEEGAAAEEAAR